jgi:signal transduction histidine kinase
MRPRFTINYTNFMKTDRDGLFDSPIWSVLEDDGGYLWMSSDKGVFRVKKKDLEDFAAGKRKSFHSISYGTEDGMRSSECDGAMQPAGWKDRDGNLWFPTLAGVVRVEPGLAAKPREAPPALIEEVLIDDKPVDSTLGGRLPPGGRKLEFHYAAPTFAASKEIHFRYRLEGFDSEWTDVGTRRVAYYTNLRPGAYQFEVTTSSADGAWTGNKALVDFYLTPHFYQTYWFYSCCLLSACGLVFILHNLRIRTLKASERFLNEQVAERTVKLEQEITERKRAEESAELARAAAETANRAKSDFLACMSHEIRTPMNGIIGMTELVLDSELASEQRESLGLVRLSAESLLSIINDILDFSKIEAGKMDLERIPFDLRESLGETMKALGIRAHQKGLELVYEVQQDVPEPLVGDPGRIRQVLINLVGNSVKFTESGEVFVGVVEESTEPGATYLHFTVRDTGVGIPPDKQKKIFEAFSQADGSTARKYGGTGLGLTICTRIVAMMGGKIWVESVQGEGSTFHFALRLGVQETSSMRSLAVEPEQLADLHVLVVDDNFTNRRVLCGMLARWGMQPTAVEGGRPALQALEIAKSTGHRFPLILLDGHMPEMDGFALAENIKKDPELVGATIMMLTSAGHLGDAARCRELGISACEARPSGRIARGYL